LDREDTLGIKISGIDPQLYLPPIELPPGATPMLLQIRLRVISQEL
jgi:hypothetical protein